MQEFTGWEYLLIDVANHFGLDKENFELRIEWALEHLDNLEDYIHEADTPYRYIAAVRAIRDAQAGVPSGYTVGWDACASGPSLMSVMVGCRAGCEATGLIDPNNRKDAYKITADVMNVDFLPKKRKTDVTRKQIKKAQMPLFYGSQRAPRKLFGGKTTVMYKAFMSANHKVFPGAMRLMDISLKSWQPDALVNAWDLPDGYMAYCPVLTKEDKSIEIDELDHMKFKFRFTVNKPQKKGLSLVANPVHSVDGFAVREVSRRCNYNREQWAHVLMLIEDYVSDPGVTDPRGLDVNRLEECSNKHKFLSVVTMEHITALNIHTFTKQYLINLYELASSIMATHEPFEMLAIHDEFKCLPNYANHMRAHYRDFLCQLADSDVIQTILRQIRNDNIVINKMDPNISRLIKGANYHLS